MSDRNEMSDNEMVMKIVQSVAWALCAALCTLIGSIAIHMTVKDVAAINAGLHQSVKIEGGYWTK